MQRAIRWPKWWPWDNEARRQRRKAAYALELDQLLAAAEVLVGHIDRLIETARRRP